MFVNNSKKNLLKFYFVKLVNMENSNFIVYISGLTYAGFPNYRILSHQLSLIQLQTQSSSMKLMLVRTLSPSLFGLIVILIPYSVNNVFAAISNSFGFGGHNSVVVFAPFKP